MNTSAIAMGVALVVAIGLVISMAGLSLTIGAIEFLFGKPKFLFLKSQKGPNGLAFALKWNSAKEPASIDYIKVKLYNPFGKPQQVEVTSIFPGKTNTFAEDLNMGPGMETLLKAHGIEQARVVIEVGSKKNGVSHQFEMPWPKFRENLAKARETAESFNAQNEIKSSRPYFEIPKRSFIAENFATSNKALKIASNPEFAGDFSSAGGDGQTTVENFLVSKVWINEGCIVCDACEGIYPEVFEVKSDTCVIRPDAPLDNGLKIQEAAEACPVEVIKYNKA